MNETNIGRRDWMKLGGLSGIAALLAGRSLAAPENSETPSEKPPGIKGIVFMVSDGMSSGVLTMTENFSKITRERGTAWWKLIDNPAAARGFMETSSANSYVTDSAAASSAWGGGAKVNNGSINVRTDGTESEPILRHLKKLGLRTGLVSTATITHATPAGFAAVSRNRSDENFIAPQYLNNVDIILGGGLIFFDKEKRNDGRDLISEYTKAGYTHVTDRDSLLKTDSECILGLFSDSHIPFDVDRKNNPELAAKLPTLAEMSEVAMKRMLSDDKKFLLQIEGARIDHAAHANDIAALLHDQLAFDDAIAKVLEMTAGRDDILIVVTSDHGNANPGLNGTGNDGGYGYGGSNRVFNTITHMTSSYDAIIQQWGTSKENTKDTLAALIFEKLGFKLKPEEAETLHTRITGGEAIEWSGQLDNPNGLLGQFAGNHTGIGWTGTSHTSDPTTLTAIGPGSHLFSGIVPNNEVRSHFIELLG